MNASDAIRFEGLKVWIPFTGKSLFDNLRNLPLLIDRAETPPAARPDVIVFPYPYPTNPQFAVSGFEHLAAHLPEGWKAPLVEGRTRIVLDASPEGDAHDGEMTEVIHRGLRSLGAPGRCCVLVTQERNYAADYGAYCEVAGVADRMRVVNYDYWIKRFHQQFDLNGQECFELQLKDFQRRPVTRGRKFLSLNLASREHKMLFLLKLLKDEMWDLGHISFGGLDGRTSNFHPQAAQTGRSLSASVDLLRAMPGFADLVQELAPLAPRLHAKGRILLGDVKQHPDTGRVIKTPLNFKLAEYDDSWFSVVTESDLRDRVSRITEKPFKALVNFHPIIVLGNPGALRQIRAMGFETFGEVIDESYDEEPDPRRRFDMVYEEVRRLCGLDDAQWARMHEDLAPKLAANARCGLVDLPRAYRDRYDLEVVTAIFPAREPL